MQQTARALNSLCQRWLNRRHHRPPNHHTAAVIGYHQRRNLAATLSRLRRYRETQHAL
jgi:hypothetical protein